MFYVLRGEVGRGEAESGKTCQENHVSDHWQTGPALSEGDGQWWFVILNDSHYILFVT